jgi:hypothetical protein
MSTRTAAVALAVVLVASTVIRRHLAPKEPTR